MWMTFRHCWSMLEPRERAGWLLLLPLAGLGAALETLGAAAVYGLIAVLAEPSRAERLPGVGAWFRRLDLGVEAAVPAGLLLVTLLYLGKNASLGVFRLLQNRIVYRTEAAVARRLFERFLAAPYAFHLRRDSSDLLHATGEAVERGFRVAVLASAALAQETLVVVGVAGVTLLASPLGALAAAAVIGGLGVVLVRLLRRRQRGWGAEADRLRRELLGIQRAGLGGIKEIRVFGREGYFVDRHARAQARLAEIQAGHDSLSELPRLLLETLFVVAAALAVLLLGARSDAAELFPTLGLIAYAGFRLLPSANRILYQIGLVRFGTAPIARLHADFEALAPARARARSRPAPESWSELRLEGVRFRYEGAVRAALDGVDLTLRRGESVALVGQTGAGKSTLVDVLLGLQRPEGRVELDGQDLFERLPQWRARIGYVPQAPYLLNDTLRRNVALGVPDAEIDEARVHEALRTAQLDARFAALPDGLDTRLGERGVRLSGGERQRVAIARALYVDPDVLVLDEATSSVDRATEGLLAKALEAMRRQRTLVMIAHRLESLRGCDRILLLKDGRIQAEGSYEALLREVPGFRALAFGDPHGEPQPPAQGAS